MKHPIAASLLGVFCTIFGVAFALLGGYEAVAKSSAANWPRVQATIESGYVYETHSRRSQWCPNWNYAYAVAGNIYRSNKMEPTLTTSRRCFPTKEIAEKSMKDLPVGSRVFASYDPDNPSQSAIVVETIGFFEFLLIGSGCAFIYCGGWLFAQVIRHRRNAANHACVSPAR